MAVGMPASERMPASWPAWVGMTGQSPSPARRAARSGSNATDPDTDSGVTTSEVPSRPARSSAWRSTSATSDARASSDEARASSHAVTSDGTALVPLGSTAMRPKVARWPASRACLLAASAVIA